MAHVLFLFFFAVECWLLFTKNIIGCQQGAKRKFYMLYELTPDESLTGGFAYSGVDYDHEFVGYLEKLG